MDNLDNILSENRDAKTLFYHDKCDKYDYLIAVGCGAIAGIIDVFILGAPGNNSLATWTDGQVDKAVMNFQDAVDGHPEKEKKTMWPVLLVFWKKVSG